jgi:hypothetical protein
MEKKMKKNRIQFIVIILVLGVLLLAACGVKEEEAPITVPAGAQAGDLVGLESCTFTTKDEVDYDAECGTLVVPEDWDNLDSRLIALRVIRLIATGDNPTEPIIRLAGGPGETNIVAPARTTWLRAYEMWLTTCPVAGSSCL